MNEVQLSELLGKLVKVSSEDETVEFKVNNLDKKEIGKRISALANSACIHERKNAYLVFGIEDGTHYVVGTKLNPKKKVGDEELEFWLNKALSPNLDFRIYSFIYKKEQVVLFEIPPAVNQPVRFNNIAYIRIGSATPKLSDYPEKERKIWNNINKNSFERGIAKEGLTVSEVLGLLDHGKYFSLTKQSLPTKIVGFVEKMEQHGLVKKVFDDSYDITNLGVILFAKDISKIPSVKRKAVRVIQYEGSTRVKRIKEQEGQLGYAISFEGLLEYINDRLPSNEEIKKSLREEVKMYPEVAIREFVANALIHQDLSISGAGPLIEIFEDRVEIINTGEPLIETDRFIDHPSRSRNEDLASFMRQIGVCEESGTGIDRALVNIELYQLPAPKFEKYQGHTKVTLYAHKKLKDMTIDDKIRACFQHCVLRHVENKRMTNASLRERLSIGERNYPAASAIIKQTIEKGLIKESERPKEYIPFWA